MTLVTVSSSYFVWMVRSSQVPEVFHFEGPGVFLAHRFGTSILLGWELQSSLAYVLREVPLLCSFSQPNTYKSAPSFCF